MLQTANAECLLQDRGRSLRHLELLFDFWQDRLLKLFLQLLVLFGCLGGL